jgi:hypothetical protein
MGETDAIVGKYDVDGNLLWMKQLGGTSFDASRGVVPDGLGNVFYTGRTKSSLGGPNAGDYDAFLAKYDAAGNQIWLDQYGGSEREEAGPIATDANGNLYVTELVGGFWDSSHLTKYDNDGSPLWSQALGGTDGLDAWRVSAVDSHGNVYVNGSTSRSLGAPNAGSSDAFLRKYSPAGQLLWTFQLGSSQAEFSFGKIAVDDLGHIVLVGDTGGDLAAPYAGGWGGGDAWVAVLRDSVSVPEPASVGMFGAALALAGARRRSGPRLTFNL